MAGHCRYAHGRLAASRRTEDPRLDALFVQLKNAGGRGADRAIDLACPDGPGNGVADSEMLQGLQALSGKDGEGALAALSRAAAPDFAEAWNKRAAVDYPPERHGNSVRSVRKTLEPRHFGALSCPGPIRLARGREALAVFDLATAPWPPGADTAIRHRGKRSRGARSEERTGGATRSRAAQNRIRRARPSRKRGFSEATGVSRRPPHGRCGARWWSRKCRRERRRL